MSSSTPRYSTWGKFGTQQERGTANYATTVRVRQAASLITTGEVINLDYPMGAFTPSLAGRRAPVQTITQNHPDQFDDYFNEFYPQCSSHIDGLRHRRHHDLGFYNGVPDNRIVAGQPSLGIQAWAEEPIVGRGVLLDIAGYRSDRGSPLDHSIGESISTSELDAALQAQGTTIGPGDILLLHTGWAHWYIDEIDEETRRHTASTKRATGLEGTTETINWLHNHKIALAASDTFSLEASPPKQNGMYGEPHEPGFIHQELIAIMGLPIGEQWLLHNLAQYARKHRRYQFFTICKPLNMIGAVGSPANAMVIA